MKNTQDEFAKFLIDSQVIEFGEFKLKSSRISPYFFNFGKLSRASLLNKTAHFYARFIIENGLSPDIIFGPAYKGIPLGVATALALQRDFDYEVKYSFNRKEVKSYGDGGLLVGESLSNASVMIVDDVITSGMTIDDTIEIIRSQGGHPLAYLVALDRQECALDTENSALQAAMERLDLNIFSITTIQHVISCLQKYGQEQEKIDAIQIYLNKYGAKR
ncbi:orotate phosphoribosyltransferase [Pectobacterium polaris]|uniref:orotate phosphoribosyltransferase n=1 Tax=Pectobacterium polaris TaxID=2042057 RepID=UPI0015839606|nr:orotate phosphoribosyltransferase [Pectobacterium polaris]MDE8743108.1 orotate phosphoribosyltransferase [Pectobacterium polaris]MDE8753965.1 orotate phosphoribosyltransferase [Pectobacterium polaris]